MGMLAAQWTVQAIEAQQGTAARICIAAVPELVVRRSAVRPAQAVATAQNGT